MDHRLDPAELALADQAGAALRELLDEHTPGLAADPRFVAGLKLAALAVADAGPDLARITATLRALCAFDER